MWRFPGLSRPIEASYIQYCPTEWIDMNALSLLLVRTTMVWSYYASSYFRGDLKYIRRIANLATSELAVLAVVHCLLNAAEGAILDYLFGLHVSTMYGEVCFEGC